MKTRAETNRIIVHHTAFKEDVSAKEIDSWHVKRGFSMIGYHYLIHYDGSIEVGRPIEVVGAHAKGRNMDSIGVCLSGMSTFTMEQYCTLAKLIKSLNTTYCKKLELEEHHEECPSKGFSWETLERLVG